MQLSNNHPSSRAIHFNFVWSLRGAWSRFENVVRISAKKLEEKRYAEILEFKFLFLSLSFFFFPPLGYFSFFSLFSNENFVKVLVLWLLLLFFFNLSAFFPVAAFESCSKGIVVSYFSVKILSMIFIVYVEFDFVKCFWSMRCV